MPIFNRPSKQRHEHDTITWKKTGKLPVSVYHHNCLEHLISNNIEVSI